MSDRKPNDFYPTPVSIVTEIIERYINPYITPQVWEPCVGDERVADALKSAGCAVVGTDITRGQDFFGYTTALASSIVTNPPFKHIRPFIDHAFDIGVEHMILVCPERLWACKKGREQFQRHPPRFWANMDWREDYLGKGGAPDRALAVAVWDKTDLRPCEYEIWSRR
jgi:hypothetical protein